MEKQPHTNTWKVHLPIVTPGVVLGQVPAARVHMETKLAYKRGAVPAWLVDAGLRLHCSRFQAGIVQVQPAE